MAGRLARACLRFAALAPSLLVLSGCYTAGLVAGSVTAPLYSVADGVALAVSPDFPKQVVELQNESLAEIHDGATYGSAWYELEYARRLENGIGVARDPVCAFVIYERNRDAYNGGRSGDRGMLRLETDPAVADYIVNGPRRRIGDCISGHKMTEFDIGALHSHVNGGAPQRND